MKGTDGALRTAPVWGRLTAYLLSLTLVVALMLPASQAQTGTRAVAVADVVVTGNRAVPTASVLATVRTRPGRDYVNSIVEDDVRRLTATGSFKNVGVRTQTTSDGRVIVEFVVDEYPNLISDVIVKNARHLKEEEIESLKAIRKGGPLNPTLNRKAANEMEEWYRSKGRLFAHVEIEEGKNPTDHRVVFNVTEGPVVRIRSIQFTGNETLASQARLATQINSSKMFLYLPIGGVYNPALVEHDLLKLKEYYKSNGYMDVEVTRELKFNDNFSTVDLMFHLREGQRYKVGNVTVDGIKTVPQGQVEHILKVRRDEPYKQYHVDVDKRNIADLIGWRGHQVQVKEELYYPEPGVVHVRYEVNDSDLPPAKVGQIHIVGNEVTKDRVIRRLLGLFPGQTLAYPELRIAEQNLTRSTLFEVNPELGIRPTVSVVDSEQGNEFKDIIVQVKEAPTGSFMVGVGVSSDSGLVGQIVLNERNFDIFRPPLSLQDVFEGRAWRGGGQEFRIEAAPGTELQRYSVSFREPFFLDLPWSLGLSGYYFDRVFNEYLERRSGGRISLGHFLGMNREWSLTGSLRLEEVRVERVPFFAPVDYLAVRGSNLLVAPRVSVAYDRRDSFLRPTEGVHVEASYEQVLGDFNFPVLSLEGSAYFTTLQRTDGSGKHVLAAHSHIAWAGDDAPVFERFFAGGFRSLRGFQFRGVGPFTGGFNVGGRFMFLNSLEYQMPIRANDQLYVVAFLDSGTVESNMRITDYRLTAGFGLRLVVPMMGPVPIAFDFGFPLIRGPFDRDQIFSFYVGVTR